MKLENESNLRSLSNEITQAMAEYEIMKEMEHKNFKYALRVLNDLRNFILSGEFDFERANEEYIHFVQNDIIELLPDVIEFERIPQSKEDLLATIGLAITELEEKRKESLAGDN